MADPRWEDTIPVEKLPEEGIPKAYIPRYEDTTPVGPRMAQAALMEVPRYEDTQPVTAPPPKEPLPPVTDDDKSPPGTWQTIKSAFGRGTAQEAADLATGTRMLLPEGVGGYSFDQQYQKSLASPEHKDYVDNLLSQGIGEGWSNPKWWGAKIANNLGSVVPGLGVAVAGSMTPAGPLGGIAGFAGEAAIASLPKAYNAARAKGMDDEAAIRQAIKESGIAASFAAAMGLVGKFNITKSLTPYVSDEIAKVLERPVSEALVQLGVVQPSLMAGQDLASGFARGETPTMDALLTDMAVGGLAGAAIHQVFKERGGRDVFKEPGQMTATDAVIQEAAAAQAGQTGQLAKRLAHGAEPAAPVGVLGPSEDIPEDDKYFERDLTPRTRRDGEAPFMGQEPDAFYSKLTRAIEDMPNELPAQDVYPWLKRKGVKDAELADAHIPAYLADVNSKKVNKEDLMGWVEANRVRVFEKIYREPAEDPMANANILYDNYAAQYGTRNQRSWPPRAQRHMAQVFAEGQAAAQEVAKTSPQYKAQALPGMRENPEEITFRTPTPEYTQEQIDARGREKWGTDWERVKRENPQEVEAIKGDLTNEDPNVFTGSHHSDPNTFAHARTYMMRDRDGHLTMVVAEMQSDAHQKAAARVGSPEDIRRMNEVARQFGVDPVQERVGYMSELRAKIKEAKAREKEAEDLAAKAEAEWKAMKPGQEGYRAKGDEVMELQRAASDAYLDRQNLENKRAVPDLPFKTNWQDLLAKRLVMLAVNRGATRLAWYNGDQVGLRLENADQLRGARANYDKKVPSLFEKQAKQYGEHVGETNFPDRPEDPYAAMRPGPFVEQLRDVHRDMGLDMERVNGPLRYITLSPKMAENLYHHGEALYDTPPRPRPGKGKGTLSDVVQSHPNADAWKALIPDFNKLDLTINKISQQLGITRGISWELEQNPNAPYRGFMYKNERDPITGNYKINVNLHRLMNRNELYASMAHEFGHVIMVDKYRTAPDSVKAALKADWLKKYGTHVDPATGLWAGDPNATVGQIRQWRDNPISLMAGGRSMHDHYLLSDLVPKSQRYFLSFEEYFAEQTSKWMQTDERPLGVVDGFFKRLGNVIRKAITAFMKTKDGPRANADPAIRDWLNHMFDKPKAWAEPHDQQFDMDTTKKAKDAFDREGAPETMAVPQQGSSGGGREIIAGLPPSDRGHGEAMAAHADRMNWFYKWFTGLPQVQELNKHIQQLAMYLSQHRAANIMKNTIMGAAHDRLKQWAKITDPQQLFALTNFIQEYAHLPQRPNPQTPVFRDLVQKHKLSDQSVRLFQGIQGDFDGFLEKYRTALINDALKIKDDTQRNTNIANINAKVDELLRRPFMPITHFGKYSITVYDAKDNVVHYEQTNSLRRQKQIKEELEKSLDRFPGDKVLVGMVPKDVTPFMGMPPGMMELIGQKLNLSKTQRAALDQLRFDYAPAQTFKHQFRNLDLVPGYSTDFMRAYAHFFFHGANHLTRISFVDQMRDQIRSLGSVAERLARVGNERGANQLDKIVGFMQDHFNAWSDPKNDWATLRGLMFHWYLGLSPVAAANNLTQTALSTYPWMASKYGDVKTIKALTKASLNLNNFYKKGTLEEMGKQMAQTPGPEGAWARAAAEAVTGGTLTETQGHLLAAISEDRNLLRPFGKTAEKFWLKFSEASGWMFDLSEQYNRRVAFRAVWDIAMREGPDHAAVKEAIAQDPLLWERLTSADPGVGKNWSKQEAAAFMAAKHAVDKTQFEYSPYARPAIMTGKAGAFFIFKQFTQNMLFNLASNPGMLGRWLVIMAALGGVGGIAGYENVNSVVKTVAARLFGKDFDLDDEVRHFAHDVLNDVIAPDTLLHGQAAKGFGIPHVMHSIGANWFPTVDMSKAVGMGDVLGFDPMKLMQLAPSRTPREAELRELGKASGAAFQIPFSLFDFAGSNASWDSVKAYEPLLPHWLGAMTHAWRWGVQGREVNSAGNTLVRFDPADTEHMAEIFARVLGFQPRRFTEELERQAGLRDSAAFYDLRHSLLLRQYGDAVKNNDGESEERVLAAIEKFNDQLPDEAAGKAITGKALKASIRQRMGIAEKAEEGIPAQKSNIPLLEKMEPYYPRGWAKDQVGAKPVQ